MTLAILGNFFFNTKTGQLVAAGLGAAMLFSMWLVHHDAKVADRARAAIVKKSEEVGKANGQASEKAHVAAAKPGAPDRVRLKFCRDCSNK